ncbi:hypothetical protein FOA52_015417 [Chlamydomonas sp. UWO 241]|nr:hypothetical protein FOA52_015417 [Chlamydomonas sp. UWO 241]
MDDAQAQMRKAIMAVMNDTTLSDDEKASRRQAILMGKWSKPAEAKPADGDKPTKGSKEACAGGSGSGDGGSCGPLDENLKCGVCLNMCERPVTAPCQHNFCLGCFRKWTQQGKKTCPSCRAPFPNKFAENPRINTALTVAIRLAKNPVKVGGPAKDYKRINNEKRPDQAFTSDKAVRSGRANAASGRIMVTIPNDHFGPITAEHDPERSQGVLVGEWWKDRLDCRQWGAHFPHVAGIAGQSGVGSQSVVLSGGYEDDRDEGEWFLYTGSGGRDLSGNKRTNKVQSFDQEFDNMNKALKMSCQRGLPVRVVRSFKEKRSSYAPTIDTPVRYDGIYRILRCWRKPGAQGPLVCRYLFVRCDNAPAPWHTGETGDDESLEIPAEALKEMKGAQGQVFEMGPEPMWSYLPAEGRWGWAKPPPPSNRLPGGGSRPNNTGKNLRKKLSEHEKALKEFSCGCCKAVCTNPITTPCGHNFCKGCLDGKFTGISDIIATNHARAMRVRHNVKPCPAPGCKADLCEFLSGAQVNRDMMATIATLQQEVDRARAEAAKLEAEAKENGGEGSSKADGVDGEDADGEDAGAGAEEGEDEDGGDGEEERGCEGPSGSGGAGPSGSAADVDSPPAAAVAVPAASAAPAPAKERFADELASLADEFPGTDVGLLRMLLEDQAGDMADVRVMVNKMNAPVRKPQPKKEATPKKEKAPAKKRGRPAAKKAEAAEGEDEEAAVEEKEASVEEKKQEAVEEGAAVDAAPAKNPRGRPAAKKAAAPAENEDGREAAEEAAPAKKPRGRPAAKKAASPAKKDEDGGAAPAKKRGRPPTKAAAVDAAKKQAESEEAAEVAEPKEEGAAGPSNGAAGASTAAEAASAAEAADEEDDPIEDASSDGDSDFVAAKPNAKRVKR